MEEEEEVLVVVVDISTSSTSRLAQRDVVVNRDPV